MIAQDAPPPPKGVLTLKEEEKLNKLRQDRHDAAREERELLLFVREKASPDYRYTEGFGRFEHLVEGMTDREREGFSLLGKNEFIRWGKIQKRAFAAVRAQYKLTKVIINRVEKALKQGQPPNET